MTKEERRKAAVTYQDELLDSGEYRSMSISDHFLAGAEAEAESKCDHKLVDVSNNFIHGGYMCVICNKAFKANVTNPLTNNKDKKRKNLST